MDSILILSLVLMAAAAAVLGGWVLWRRRSTGSSSRTSTPTPELKDSGEDINKVKRRLDFEIQKNIAQTELADRLSNASRAARRAQRSDD